jgi:NAD+ synthase
MATELKMALAQVNVTVGDIEGNLQKIFRYWKEAKGADLVVFPELALTGYPAEDLVLRPSFQKQAMDAARRLAKMTAQGPALLTGGLWAEKGKLHNAAFLMEKGAIRHIQPKHELPNYGVFDEKRHFHAGPLPTPVEFRKFKIGILVCEDMWHPLVPKALKGADVVLSINASPFELDKRKRRQEAAKAAASKAGCPLLYVNMVAGQDDIVFDGDSFVMTEKGSLACAAGQFEEKLLKVSFTKKKQGWQCVKKEKAAALSTPAQQYHAMVLGLRDYVEKNSFPGVVLGLSGGVDSALSAAVAVDALGAEKVKVLMLPSRYTSGESFEDAAECARRLGLRLDEVPIEGMMKEAGKALGGVFAGTKAGVTEENVQSRIRGLLLMAYSNKFGHMVLTTGNKSELATGYATLYGDMCGGFNVLKDTYKMQVYALCEWRNKNRGKDFLGPRGEVIPPRVTAKAPTAELRPNQKDEDSLPPYEVLDGILDCLIEKECALKEIVAEGYDRKTVERVAALVYKAEYKRRQSAPGVKVTGKSFGRDRRYPITNGFKEGKL